MHNADCNRNVLLILELRFADKSLVSCVLRLTFTQSLETKNPAKAGH